MVVPDEGREANSELVHQISVVLDGPVVVPDRVLSLVPSPAAR